MRTPDEVKKGLECCAGSTRASCSICPYKIPGWDIGCAIRDMKEDALAYIQQLERERDAAVDEIFQTCSNCKYEKQGYGVWPCPPVEEYVKTTDCSNWQWRGVQEVE